MVFEMVQECKSVVLKKMLFLLLSLHEKILVEKYSYQEST